VGISADQINTARQQIVEQARTIAENSLPYLRSIFNAVLDTFIVAVLSIYFLIDGSRITAWIRRNAPTPARANFVLDTLQRVVGGYIRGQFILAVLIGALVGLGMGLIFRLPYAAFLGVLAFIMAFIPVLGTFISGAICALVGLTHGWLVAVGVLIYFIAMHIIEGDVVGPRIVGKAVGLHPIISLFALVAGSELFGIWGALFASPIAGVLQAAISALWIEWRAAHPAQFQQKQEQVLDKLEDETGPPLE
jgi:predicted PurR-regulated permease PerM